MHDFQRVAVRAPHMDVLRRAEKDDKEETTTTTGSSSESKSSATQTSTSSSSKSTQTTSSSTSTSAKTTSTSSTSTSTSSGELNLSSLLGVSSTSSSTSSSSTSSSSTSSTLTTTSTSGGNAVTQTFTSVAAASATSSDTASDSSSGLSGAATGGIIAGCVLAGIALLIFAIRKTFIRRRQRKRNTWGAGMFPDVNDKYSANDDLPPSLPEKNDYLGVNNASPRTPVWAPVRPSSPSPSGYHQLAPPPATYNNPVMDAMPSLPPPQMAAADPVGFRPATGASFRPPSSVGETATVRVVYVPTLPDELSISAGEIVTVVKAYDDGWALCQNSRGEQGVCPLECLDRSAAGNQMIHQGIHSDAASVHTAAPADGDWRNVKRLSSLSSQQHAHY